MAKHNWSKWIPLRTIPDTQLPDSPGAYIIATRSPINRAIGIDKLGSLTIGESCNLRKRINTFLGCASGRIPKGHMAGWRYNQLSLSRAFPLEELWCKWVVAETKEEAYAIEGQELRKYVNKHGELPPLNYKYNWAE